LSLVAPTLEQIASVGYDDNEIAVQKRLDDGNLEGNKRWAANQARVILVKYGDFGDDKARLQGATSWVIPDSYLQPHRHRGVELGYRLSTAPVPTKRAGAVALELSMWASEPGRFPQLNKPADANLTYAAFYDERAAEFDLHHNNGDIYIRDPRSSDLNQLSTPEELRALQDTLEFIADSEQNRAKDRDIKQLTSYLSPGY
jgi:hypothetical protein